MAETSCTNPPNPGTTEQGADEIKDKAPQIIVQGGLYNRVVRRSGRQDLTIYLDATKEASKIGYTVLLNGGTAIDAVEAAVRHLEENEYFNAGRGSFWNKDGDVECDGMIMDGHELRAGAVMAVRHFLHPVTLSRAVMEKSKHCVLCADGALAFARSIDFQTILENPDELKIPDANNRQATLPDEGYGDSVTAVALDSKGRMACAISTGGTPDKLMGRVGDAPLIGCGGYANEHGAVTACGHGESIIKMNLAKEIVHNIEKEQSAQEAAENAVKKVNSDSRVGRFVGVIAIDKGGNIGVKTNAAVMPWASIKDNKMKFGWHQNIFETVDI